MTVVMFDLDNTLFDHLGSARIAVVRMLSSIGINSLPDDFMDLWFETEARHYQRWLDGEITFWQQRRERMLDVLDALGAADRSSRRLDELFDVYIRSYEAAWRPFPDAVECLRRLVEAKCSLHILSNGKAEQQLSKLKKVGLVSYFDTVSCSDRLGASKPDSASFRMACSRIGVPVSDVTYIGDNFETDYVGAKRAGLMAVHLHREDCRSDCSGARTVKSLRAVPAAMGVLSP